MSTYPLEPKLKAALGTLTGVFAVLYAVAEVLRDTAVTLPAWATAAVSLVLALGAAGFAGHRAPHQYRGGELRSAVDHPAGRDGPDVG